MRLSRVLALALAITACRERRLVVTVAEGPAQRTLSEVRALYDEPIDTCLLPSVPAPASAPPLVSLDSGLRTRVPGRWTRGGALDSTRGRVSVVWRDDNRRKIEIARETNGLKGPAYFMSPSNPVRTLPTCALSVGSAGAIWRRYDSVRFDSTARRRYLGFGEIVTRDSLRYRVEVGAESAADRDSLAGWVTSSVIP